ncbi:MAG: ABC transporter ATP-binding protein [Deltaproteobacteria bacterium]|nr:ABC transporter ATP-binding protein [Deltaproteobacteria bacterium]
MIRLNEISRVFTVGEEDVHALDRVTIDIAPGEYLAIMGPSGSGKSTLLNVIGLLDRPDYGEYYLDNVNTTELDDDRQAFIRRHRIGFVFQFFHLVPRLTATQNVELPLILAGVTPKERKERVKKALASMELTNRSDHRPDQLSGGQRQRVAIARAIIMEPGVILADEPTGNLDRTSGMEVMNILEGLNRKGITLIMVTHDPGLSKRAGRRIQMTDGRVSEDTGLR